MSLLKEGHPTLISFSLNPSVKFYEKTVTPPGYDGGGINDTTTMRNVEYRTRQPKVLKTLTEMSGTAAYDSDVMDPAEVLAMVNINQEITITYSDGAEFTFWGWLNEFKPNEVKEGEQPTANFTIIPSNQDNDGVEQAPSFTPAP